MRDNDAFDSISMDLIVLANLYARSFHHLYGSKHGVNVSEWRVLLAVHGTPGISVLGLAERLGAARMTTSRAVSKLARVGLIEVDVDSTDERRRRVFLSEQGAELYQQLVPTALQVENRVSKALAPPERRELRRLLNKVEVVLRDLDDRDWDLER